MSLLRPKAIFQYLILIVSINQTPLFAQTIADLDRIQDKASSYKEFSANAKLRKEYVAAAQSYFGSEEAFPQVSFDAILAQLDQMAESDAILAERIWRKEVLGPTFTINIGNGTSTQVDTQKWNNFLTEVKGRLKSKSGSWLNWWLSPNSAEQFVKAVEAAEKDFKNAMAQQKYSKEMLEEMVRKNESLIAGLLLYQIELTANKEGLQSSAWETISAVTHKFSSEQKTLQWEGHFSTSPRLVNYWKHLELNFMRAEHNFSLYGSINNQNANVREVTFRAVRTFHALFRGLPVKECTAGDCTLLAGLSPRRYGIPLLNHVWVQFMEEASHGSGHLQGVFMQHSATKATVLNMDFMAGKLREIVTIGTPGTKTQSVSVFELWLKEITKRLKNKAVGIAMSEAMNADNEKMQEFIHEKKYYLLGQDVGSADSFDVLDGDMAYRISKLGWRLEKEHHYGNCLTFDGCDVASGNMTLLNPEIFESKELTDIDLKKFWQDPAVSKWAILTYSSRTFQLEMAKADAANFKAAMLDLEIKESGADLYIDHLANNTRLSEDIILELKRLKQRFILRGLSFLAKGDKLPSLPIKFTKNDKDLITTIAAEDEASQKALFSQQLSRLKDLGELASFQHVRWLIGHYKSILPDELFQIFGEVLGRHLQEAKLDLSDILYIRKQFFSIEADIEIIKNSYRKFSNTGSLITLLGHIVKNPSAEYKSALDELRIEMTTHFISLQPTNYQMIEWMKSSNYVVTIMQIRKELLNSASSTSQILTLFKNEYGLNTTPSYTASLAVFIENNWRAALQKIDNLDDYLQFLPFCTKISQCLEFREAGLRLVKAPQQFFSLYTIEIFTPHDSYIRELRSGIARQVDFFLALQPPIPMVNAYIQVIYQVDPKATAKLQDYKLNFSKEHPVKNVVHWMFPGNLAGCAKLLDPKN